MAKWNWLLSNNPQDTDSDTLKMAIRWCNEHIQELEVSIANDKRDIAIYQAELDRRALAAYWEAHPDLEPVYVGDKLMVTERLADEIWSKGTITTVERIDIKAPIATCTMSSDSLSHWRTGYLSEACEERRAYLSQQPVAQ